LLSNGGQHLRPTNVYASIKDEIAIYPGTIRQICWDSGVMEIHYTNKILANFVDLPVLCIMLLKNLWVEWHDNWSSIGNRFAGLVVENACREKSKVIRNLIIQTNP
jgi:hypothetical protein